MTKKNEGNGLGQRLITSKNQRIMKPWNDIQLARLKYWQNVVQEYQMGQLWFDILEAAYTEDTRMML